MKQHYTFDQDHQVWERIKRSPLSYSDGDAAEEYMLSVLRNASDVSSFSCEMRSAIRDWPSEYHLSPVRHNLFRPFQVKHTDKILELGCGCGAISRYLGEMGATVVAVEGSQRRAQIAAQRCRDLPNVSIYCDNIIDFISDEKFDYVTLIGVLEYARVFIDSDDPIRTCLEHARSFLKKDCTLILAIENQLGLKYFNGCREDHIGISYFGIHDLYTANSPVTFGKIELESILKAAGFKNIKFFYPFPDYKLPNLILTDECLNRPDLHVSDLLYRTISRDYTRKRRRVFYGNMAWQPIIRNGLLPGMANSFLVLASQSLTTNTSYNWLARIYNTERLPEFATETVFQPEGNAITVAKRPLYPQGNRHTLVNGMHIYHQPSAYEHFVSGRLYIVELQPILARGGDLADLANWTKPWFDRLAKKAIQIPDGRMLPGDWLDAIPSNFIRDHSNNLILIDPEWKIRENIPFIWVFIRGLVNTLLSCPVSPVLANFTFRDVINKVLGLLGETQPKDKDYQNVACLEDALEYIVYNLRGYDFANLINKQVFSVVSVPTINDDNIALQKEIVRIKNTISWRITKPLRFPAFMLRTLTRYCSQKNK